MTLLVKTAATGVLATILDAAIEYRRRQLLASALPTESFDQESHLALHALSKSGIAGWKARLLRYIDELEHQHALTHPSIESSRERMASICQSKAKRVSGALSLTEEEKIASLGATIAQLRELVDDSGSGGQVVDCLLETLLEEQPHVCHHQQGDEEEERELPSTMCWICMDSELQVRISGCQHEMCFKCARRLCTEPVNNVDVPKCPFCRRAIDGFESQMITATIL